MFKQVLVAAAIALACPAFVFAQDISFLFGGGQNLADPSQVPPGVNISPGASTLSVLDFATSGSVNIFSAPGFQFDAIDLDFFSSDPSVAVITGGTVFNPTFSIISDQRFDSATITPDSGGASGTLFAVNVLNNGVGGTVNEFFDPLFDSVDGTLLATVDLTLWVQVPQNSALVLVT